MCMNRTNLLNNNQELLPWVWAIQLQLNLLDQNDALWIEEVGGENGWSDESFYNFLSSYSLLRGKRGAVLSKSENGIEKSRNILSDICNKHFSDDLSNEKFIVDVKEKWRAADDEFAAWVSNKGGPGAANNQMFMPSALMKIFWYFHPARLTMYDSLACAGLRVVDNGEVVNPDNFLERFCQFHDKTCVIRNRALEYFDFQYPYVYRITDKYLWLMGNQNKDRILMSYQASIRLQGQ